MSALPPKADVASLARPGGNITGLSLMMTETNVKGLALLKEAVPGISRLAVISDPATPSHGPGLKAVKAAGPTLGLRVQSVPVRSATEYDSAFTTIVGERADAVLVLSTPLLHRRSKAARGTVSRAQAAFALWTEASCAGRGPHELLA